MEIKEAHRYIKTHRCKILADSADADAVFTVLSAIKNGYALCKVDEAEEKIKTIMKQGIDNKFDVVDMSAEVIKALKEACE